MLSTGWRRAGSELELGFGFGLGLGACLVRLFFVHYQRYAELVYERTKIQTPTGTDHRLAGMSTASMKACRQGMAKITRSDALKFDIMFPRLRESP
jgi:hypothetical protein